VSLQKIFPALKKYYEEQGGSDSFVVISTCSEKQGMCMYYVPLSKKEVFYMGHELTEEYGVQFAATSSVEKFFGIDLDGMSFGGKTFANVYKGLKKLLRVSSKMSGKEEL
jgi:hypothetical protein